MKIVSSRYGRPPQCTLNIRDFEPAKRGGAWRSFMRRSNVALRLQPSLLEEARKVAQSEGVAVNQLINVAVAEKLSATTSGRWRLMAT
jgi:hypothetical protein